MHCGSAYAKGRHAEGREGRGRVCRLTRITKRWKEEKDTDEISVLPA